MKPSDPLIPRSLTDAEVIRVIEELVGKACDEDVIMAVERLLGLGEKAAATAVSAGQERRFLAIGSGETYSAEIVPESKLVATWEEMIFGEVGAASCQEISAAQARLSNSDYWTCDADLGRVHFREDVGETDHLDFYLIPSGPLQKICNLQSTIGN
jgi:hypothetical protein